MNDRQKMVEELMKKPLRADDEFYFRCDQCGECCKDRIDILLSPFDLCRMAKAVDEPLPEVLNKYGWREHGVTREQVYGRQSKTREGSEKLYELTDMMIRKHIEKGNIRE